MKANKFAIAASVMACAGTAIAQPTIDGIYDPGTESGFYGDVIWVQNNATTLLSRAMIRVRCSLRRKKMAASWIQEAATKNLLIDDRLKIDPLRMPNRNRGHLAYSTWCSL